MTPALKYQKMPRINVVSWGNTNSGFQCQTYSEVTVKDAILMGSF